MKKLVLTIIVIVLSLNIFLIYNSYASTNKAIPDKTESRIVELKEKEMKTLEDYQERYELKSYGLTAYILHKVQIFSIPVCFLGIIIGAINQFVIGIRDLKAYEKGLGLMIIFVTLGIICQVLPLIFTIVVKFGRE